MKRFICYIATTIQSHIDYLERDTRETCAKTWEDEQKRRRASLEGSFPNVGVDEPG